MTKITYTPNTIEIDGIVEPVRYSIRRRNDNIVVNLLNSGVPYELTPSDEGYSEALQAAETHKAECSHKAIENYKAAKADGSKWWIGQVLRGKSWKIVAEESTERIRVIFRGKPSEAQKEAVKAAGFAWSPSMKSWNRGLKNKAWKAAQELAFSLKNLDDPDAARRMQSYKLQRQIERGEAV